MQICVTGADGFIGKNLRIRLCEAGHVVLPILRGTSLLQLAETLRAADFVFHLAGVNRPNDDSEFTRGNAEFTAALCDELESSGRSIPVCYSSSIQATLDNPYGVSKRAAEERLLQYRARSSGRVYLFRLPNVFGKWCRPNYNSAVATFCHQIAHGLPISIRDPGAPLRLIYIDDVVNAFIALLTPSAFPPGYLQASPIYETTVGKVAEMIHDFAASRESLTMAPVGIGLARALYATYVSYLSPESFSYSVPRYGDARGEFVEMLKTPTCGQFSYFTAHPGVTRGEHYHHTKTEKFLIIRGAARFAFRNIASGEIHELIVRGGEGSIVESTPGWAHNITNVGDDELVVLLWANEIFDRSRPDTVAQRVVMS